MSLLVLIVFVIAAEKRAIMYNEDVQRYYKDCSNYVNGQFEQEYEYLG